MVHETLTTISIKKTLDTGLVSTRKTPTMSSGNPTLDAAQASTGMEPLNAGPTSPQPPQHGTFVKDATLDNLPEALQNLSSPFEAFVLPLDTNQRTGAQTSQTTSPGTFPNDSQFEDLVKASMYPEGPVRAEEIKQQDVKWPHGHEDVLKNVAKLGDKDGTRYFKVVRGQKKADVFVVTTDVDEDRLIGVRFAEHE